MPEDKKTIVKMAHIYAQEGRWDKAIAEYQKLIAMEPEDFNSHSMVGDVYFKKGDIQSAFDAFTLCYDAYLRLGQAEKAAIAQGKILRLNPQALNQESRKKLEIFKKQQEADAFFEQGNTAKAAEAYSAVLNLDPNRFDLYPKLGDLLLKLGDKPGACARYREIGNLYLKNRLTKKALPLFQKVLELMPDDFDAHVALADLHAKAGNESDAKREVLYLTELLFQRGDWEQALQYAQKAEQLRAIESYNYLGHIELKQGHLDPARVWFDKLLKFKPNHGGALWGMGLIQIAEGRVEDARATLGKVPKADRFYGEVLATTADLEAPSNPEDAREHYQEAINLVRAKGSFSLATALEAKLRAVGGVPLAADEVKQSPVTPVEEQLENAAPKESPVVSESGDAQGSSGASSTPAEQIKGSPSAVDAKAGEAKESPAASGAKADEGKAAAPVIKPADKEAPKAQPGSGKPAAKAAEPIPFTIQRFSDQPESAAKPKAPVAAPVVAEPEPKAEAPKPAPKPVETPEAPVPAVLSETPAAAKPGDPSFPSEAAFFAPPVQAAPPRPAEVPAASVAVPATLPVLKPAPEAVVAPAAAAQADGQDDEVATLLNLAQNFEADSSWDEALNLYQRVLALDKAHAGAREGVSRVYRQLAGSVPRTAAPAPVAAKPETLPLPPLPLAASAPVRALGPPSLDMDKLAALKAQAEASQAQAKVEFEAVQARAKSEAEAQRQRAEREAQESERADSEAKMRAEIAALRVSEAEARAQAQQAAADAQTLKPRMEAEIRARLEAELKQQQAASGLKAAEDAKRLLDVQARLKEEEDARHRGALQVKNKAEEDAKRQAEVLARVQAQQKERLERLEPLRRGLEPRPKPDAAPAAPGPLASPAHAGDDGLSDLDDFMTVAVADIYVKQGLVSEARKIYERILAREPGNAEVRGKLNALEPHSPAPAPVKAEVPKAMEPTSLPSAPAAAQDAPRKSKVSYL